MSSLIGIGNAPQDMNDTIDRKRAAADAKLEYICGKAAAIFGKDPRGGGFSFVARPRTIEQLLSELSQTQRTLQRPVVIGQTGADVIFWWKQVPMVLRHMVKGDDVWVMPDDCVAPSLLDDRRVAAEIRLAAHRGEIWLVQ